MQQLNDSLNYNNYMWSTNARVLNYWTHYHHGVGCNLCVHSGNTQVISLFGMKQEASCGQLESSSLCLCVLKTLQAAAETCCAEQIWRSFIWSTRKEEDFYFLFLHRYPSQGKPVVLGEFSSLQKYFINPQREIQANSEMSEYFNFHNIWLKTTICTAHK